MGLFHSTTCRTAGFNTVDYAALSSSTLFLAIILMAIGGGPCSTAGGFKVSTFMTLVVSSWSNFRGHRHANFFRRTIPASAIQRAAATSLLFAAVAIAALVTGDSAVAAAAAEALGLIAGPEAAAALAAAQAGGAAAEAVVDARLACAEALVKAGRKADARSIYEALSKAVGDAPTTHRGRAVRMACQRGLFAAMEG
jgi:hypothetical protein